MKLFSICAGCRKRKFYISRKWFKPKFLPIPKIQPKEDMCGKCIANYKNLKSQ